MATRMGGARVAATMAGFEEAAVSSMGAPTGLEVDASTMAGFGRAAASSIGASTAEGGAAAMAGFGGGEGRRCGAGPVMVSPAAMVARGERSELTTYIEEQQWW